MKNIKNIYKIQGKNVLTTFEEAQQRLEKYK